MDKIAVVIPTFNRKNYLRDVIDDFNNQKNGDFELQLIVVVDGSTDGTVEMIIRDYPEIKMIKGNGDWWYTKSMNEGFKKAVDLDVDYVLTMNDDVQLPMDYVDQLHKAQKEKGNGCIMGSISLTKSSPLKITFAGVPEIKWWRYKQVNYITPFSEVKLEDLKGIKPTQVLPGRGMLIPIERLTELNFFDEAMVQYGSDDDFCLRANKKDIPVFVSFEAIVYSYEKMTGAGNPLLKTSVWNFTRSFFNKYSSRHLNKTAKMASRHGNALLLPLTMLIVIIGSYKSYFKFRS